MIQKNEIFHGTVVSFDLPLRHRMIRLASGMANPFFLKISTQIFSDIAKADRYPIRTRAG